jgi:hypothetical protein
MCLNIVSMITQGVQFTSVCAQLCHVDVEEANWIYLEGLLAGFVAVNLRQSADAAALQAEIQRRSGQVQDTGLEQIEAVVERQEGVPADKQR